MTTAITPTGLAVDTLQDILAAIEADQHANVSAQLDVSPASPDGQRNGVTARALASLAELVLEIYAQFDPDRAEDDLLVSLCKLTGTTPREETRSIVKCLCDLDSGTPLISDAALANVPGQEQFWAPVDDFTAPSDGVFEVLFHCTTTGPVQAFAGTLTETNSITGWNSCTNALDARAGQPADTNETLRLHRQDELAKAGSATTRAVRADLLAATDAEGTRAITAATVLENDTDENPNPEGLPPHSIEAVILDLALLTDNQIAQVIFDAKAAGATRTAGSVLASANDEFGKPHAVRFSRTDEIPVYLVFTITPDANYPGDAFFQDAAATTLNGQHGIGDDVLRWVAERAGVVAGVRNLSVRLGFGPGPLFSADLVITARQKAVFDSSRITVEVA